jgi:hypothetical protein
MPRANWAWSFQNKPDFKSAWVGVFGKVEGHVAVVGLESAIGVIFNVIAPATKYLISIQTDRAGLGLGDSIVKHLKDPTPQLIKAANSLSELGDVYKVAGTGSGALNGDSPTISIFDIPGGKGLEIGVYRTWVEVIDIQKL